MQWRFWHVCSKNNIYSKLVLDAWLNFGFTSFHTLARHQNHWLYLSQSSSTKRFPHQRRDTSILSVDPGGPPSSPVCRFLLNIYAYSKGLKKNWFPPNRDHLFRPNSAKHLHISKRSKSTGLIISSLKESHIFNHRRTGQKSKLYTTGKSGRYWKSHAERRKRGKAPSICLVDMPGPKFSVPKHLPCCG